VLPQAVSEHFDAKKRLTVATLALLRREWSTMGRDFDASWAKVGPRATLLLASAQLGAARSGAAYVPAVLEEIGALITPDVQVNPAAFSGVASDGRPLPSLLDGAVVAAKRQMERGAPPERALSVGGRVLEMYAHTQIDDAARGAASVEIAARPTVGWVRMVSAPCCDRCAILAGKWFKFNDGFERHPQCSCTHIPAPEDTDDELGTSPEALFSGGHVRLTKGQRDAIAAGEDPARVVNAKRRRSMSTASAGVRGARVTPDRIYRMRLPRERTVELLRANGYAA
jgi:hypothetical protein